MIPPLKNDASLSEDHACKPDRGSLLKYYYLIETRIARQRPNFAIPFRNVSTTQPTAAPQSERRGYSRLPSLRVPPAPMSAVRQGDGLRPGRIVRPDGAILRLLPHAIRHMGAHSEIRYNLLKSAFSRMTLPHERRQHKEEIDFGSTIGRTAKVETFAVSPDDVVDFVYRVGRRYPSRTAFGVPRPPTSLMTVVAKRDPRCIGSVWDLETAYIGSSAPLEPLSGDVVKGGPDQQARSIDFWCRNALVYDPAECATLPFRSSWSQLLARRRALGPNGFPEGGPYWMNK